MSNNNFESVLSHNFKQFYPDSIMSDDSLQWSESDNPLNSISEDSLDKAFMKDETDFGAGNECKHEEENDPVEYLNKNVFPTLLPCLELMLFAAKENNVLKVQKTRFNGLDYLAELLWNRNPLHPERCESQHVSAFDIPFVRSYLENNPRPVYPKSWLWSEDQAAVVIQAAVRGHLVRKKPEVQELRQFWKVLAVEHQEIKEEDS